jgi:hypothetical protein
MEVFSNADPKELCRLCNEYEKKCERENKKIFFNAPIYAAGVYVCFVLEMKR